MSEFAGDLTNLRRSKMDKIAVNAFIHGGALSDPIELNPNIKMASQPDFYEPSDCNNTT